MYFLSKESMHVGHVCTILLCLAQLYHEIETCIHGGVLLDRRASDIFYPAILTNDI